MASAYLWSQRNSGGGPRRFKRPFKESRFSEISHRLCIQKRYLQRCGELRRQNNWFSGWVSSRRAFSLFPKRCSRKHPAHLSGHRHLETKHSVLWYRSLAIWAAPATISHTTEESTRKFQLFVNKVIFFKRLALTRELTPTLSIFD